MRIASIDIGSNTVLLLIADVVDSNIVPIVNEYRIPRISSGLTKTGIISEDSIKYLFKVLAEYKVLIDEHNCTKILVNGTQALRVAKNSEQIIKEIKDRFDFDLNIIPGEIEALYSFKGALSSFTNVDNYIMIDIGGASTEIVYGNKKEIFFRKSFPIGVVVSKEKFLKSNPPKEEEILNFKNELDIIFEELNRYDFKNSAIISVAGTPTTLSALKLELEHYSEDKIEKSILTKDNLIHFIFDLKVKTDEEINNQYSPIITGREDVILAGTYILYYLLDLFEKEELFVSGRGLRYGALL
jgi:exopolyphosphatase / guanosine-5'-triphosphate,3'-diphosphate pyrophosphatase